LCHTGEKVPTLIDFNTKEFFFQANDTLLFFAANVQPTTGPCAGAQTLPYFGMYDFDQKESLIFLSTSFNSPDPNSCLNTQNPDQPNYLAMRATNAVVLGDTTAVAFMKDETDLLTYGEFSIDSNRQRGNLHTVSGAYSVSVVYSQISGIKLEDSARNNFNALFQIKNIG